MSNAIVGLASFTLTPEEEALFKAYPPYGFILFQRNCKDPEQVRNLVDHLKSITRNDVPILIDQEGGRVSRLKEPNFREFKAPSHFKTPEEVYDNAVLMAAQLKDLGVNVNCTPLADLVFASTHKVIGDRSFGDDPTYIGEMAAAVIQGHLDQGVMPVLKHLPGHGRAITDSHEELPVVSADKANLEQTDFKAFRETLTRIKQPIWGMTAHILYSDIDPKYCATQSSTIIQEIIRDRIGFNGFLISDCLTMKALKGSYKEKAEACMNAGCDAVLHCSGNIDEMREILAL